MMNYKLAAMSAYSIGKEWQDHVKWLLMLEIIEVVK